MTTVNNGCEGARLYVWQKSHISNNSPRGQTEESSVSRFLMERQFHCQLNSSFTLFPPTDLLDFRS